MRRAWLLLAGACGAAPQPAQTSTAAALVSAPVVLDAGAPEAAPPPKKKPPPKRVLHAGDSFVGGHGGLTKALEPKFTALGATFARDWYTSVHIDGYARIKRLDELLKKHDPDLVILTLGAHDMFVPFPKELGPYIKTIVKKIGGRECYWITPVRWSKAKPTGMIDVVKENAAPCKVFDATGLELDLAYDHIHPSDKGGEQWADAFFDFWQRDR